MGTKLIDKKAKKIAKKTVNFFSNKEIKANRKRFKKDLEAKKKADKAEADRIEKEAKKAKKAEKKAADILAKEQEAVKKIEKKTKKCNVVSVIKLEANTIKNLFINPETQISSPDVIEGFEDWYITVNPKSGIIDSDKLATVDFELSLYDNENKFRGRTLGGKLENGSTEYVFDEALQFSNTTTFTEFFAYLIKIDYPLNKHTKKIKNLISKL